MIRIKNWSRFQHFKNRRPPWIKFYRDLLDDIEWHELDSKAAKILVMLWLIASEDSNGALPDTKTLSFRLRLPEKTIKDSISMLSHWVEHDDTTPISPRYQDDPLETEREKETEAETDRRSGDDIPKELSFKATDLMALWNQKASPSLPRVELLTKARESHIKKRLESFPSEGFWIGVIDKINSSGFLRGETGFKATFDWVINPNNLTKIIEGNYDGERRNGSNQVRAFSPR